MGLIVSITLVLGLIFIGKAADYIKSLKNIRNYKELQSR